MCCGIGSDGQPGGDGSEGHEAADVATFAEWGVEYIKDDDCGSSADHYPKMAAAIKVSYAGKPVVYSIHSPWTHNSTLRPRAVDAAGFASSWRTTNDIKDNWAAVLDRSATNDRHAVRVASRSSPPPWGVNSISPGSPHVRPMWTLSTRTCGEPELDEIKKNTHPKWINYRSFPCSGAQRAGAPQRPGHARVYTP